jgi:hypothetical protein
MKVAYLVVAHNNPQVLKREIGMLSCEDCAFFIHIDQKSNLEKFSQIRGENVVFSEKRLPVYWGGFSVVQSTLLLLRQALDSPLNYDRFVLLSGSDYPLRSGKYIHTFLQENRGVEFMNLVKIPNDERGVPLSKINRLWYEPNKPTRRFAARALAKLGFAQRDYRKYLGSLEPYGGEQWWALTRDACQYVLEFVERNRHVEKYFQNTPAPDEMFFHTILGNSAFASRTRRCLHYLDWSVRGLHPAMINDQHVAFFEAQEKVWLDDIWGSGEALFTRKFSDDRLDLVQRIDDMIARKEKSQSARG